MTRASDTLFSLALYTQAHSGRWCWAFSDLIWSRWFDDDFCAAAVSHRSRHWHYLAFSEIKVYWVYFWVFESSLMIESTLFMYTSLIQSLTLFFAASWLWLPVSHAQVLEISIKNTMKCEKLSKFIISTLWNHLKVWIIIYWSEFFFLLQFKADRLPVFSSIFNWLTVGCVNNIFDLLQFSAVLRNSQKKSHIIGLTFIYFPKNNKDRFLCCFFYSKHDRNLL